MNRFGCIALSGALVLSAPDAGAATVAEVDRLVEKANRSLQDSSPNRARSLNDAIAACQEALQLIEKVEGLSEDERQKRATEIMSTIYWCRKMMPLDLSGRAVTTGPATGGGGPSKGTQTGGTAAPPAARAGKQLDEIAFGRARAYASKNSQDLEGTLLRYEGVAASYPRSKWGQRAAKEAEKVRARLVMLRAAAANAFRGRLARLEFEAAVAALDENISKETSRAKRAQLEQAKHDVEALRLLWKRVAKALKNKVFAMALPFGDIGVEKKAWIRGGSEEGLSVSLNTKNSTPTAMSWGELGARSVVRLAGKLLNLHDGETLQQLAVAATVTEDYITAQGFFEKLLRTEPKRVNSVAAYFERALSGYKSTAEGGGRIRFKEAKDLVKKKSYGEAMALLASLQKDLARDSTLQEFLTEVDAYRRRVRKRHEIDDEGNPITSFERKVRRVFGGDVRLDETTGRIEVVYDFSEGRQLRDWGIVDSHMKPSSKGGWMIQSGACKCLGKNNLFMWKFPLLEFDVRADVVYLDQTGRCRTVIHSCMTKRYPHGVWAWCRGGEAKLNAGRLRNWGWMSMARFIWRPGELATLRFVLNPDSGSAFRLTVNGDYAISGPEAYQPGCIAFNFDGGRGSVDDVRIRGVLSRKLMRQIMEVR